MYANGMRNVNISSQFDRNFFSLFLSKRSNPIITSKRRMINPRIKRIKKAVSTKGIVVLI
jgi:hypothetical protein